MPAGENPADLLAALDAMPPARARFDALPRSHQREYIKWIEEAKKQPMRQRRIEETVRKLAAE